MKPFELDKQLITMSKVLAPGRVVIILSGRFAGKKAVVTSVNLNGNNERKYGFVTVVGVERSPLKITRKMSETLQHMRTSVKAFCKVINVNHVMPTKYTVKLEDYAGVKDVKVANFKFNEPYPIKDKKVISSDFADHYRNGKDQWFFAKLRF